MGTIATDQQTRWRTCFATSERVKLTLATTGEQKPFLIRPDGIVVYAGLEAPTVAPTFTSGGTGITGYFYYVYVYSSTQYPYIQNAQTTADGKLWPRSNPSPRVATGSVTDDTVTVTVTKTTRSDVDKILLYRTLSQTTSAAALAASNAGEYFYVGQASNNGIAGTTTIADDNPDSELEELIELDNYTPDVAWFCTFDGTYWWMVGSPPWEAEVTLDGTSVVTITDATEIFDGRNSQVATFDGVTTGGFDGRGSWYAGRTSATTVTLYTDSALANPNAVAYSGTTVMHLSGRASVLYRSKPYNPMSWGFTETLVTTTDNVENTTIVPQSFALELGGGSATAIAVVPSGKLLKVDFENPQRTITLDLESAELDTFGSTQRVIDETGSVTAHFTQYHGYISNDPVLIGLDTYNGNILACDGFRQVIVSDVLGGFLLSLDRSDNAHRFYHGGYDPDTELNCFWVRFYDTTERINAMVWMHSGSGQWGWTPDLDVSASCTILDSEENVKFLLGGTEEGHTGRLFYPGEFDNWMNGVSWVGNYTATSVAITSSHITFDTVTASPTSGSQVISFDSSADLFFTTTGDPICAVGDDVILIRTAASNANVTRTVTRISGTTVYIDSAWGLAGTPNRMQIGSTRLNSTWAVISKADGLTFWLCKVVQTAVTLDTNTWTISWRVDEYFERGDTIISTTTGTAPFSDGALVHFGEIPCLFRTYFDLDVPFLDKSPFEAWLTVDNVDASIPINCPLLAIRLYQEYNEDSTAALTTNLTQSVYASGSLSTVWFNKTSFPTGILKQFGIEISNIGYENFTFQNYSLRLSPFQAG